MALPTYDKSKRRKTYDYEQLPKNAYVVTILNAKERPWANGKGSNLEMAFDIAEGEYAGFYRKQFDSDEREDKKWPNDGVFRIQIPTDTTPDYVYTNWNTFFADLEDSNNGFVFSGDPKTLKGKIIGGKFYIEQSEQNGNVYDHTRFRYSCSADKVRSGKFGRLPNDKLIAPKATKAAAVDDGFMQISDTEEEELPF